ncbi:MAG: dihydrolipoyl dehydrogenase [Deltaproteobacteria bacterium]|nr:dihydrolipoyl dehydrogenase [Deltaproteobacteria bacterium]
MSNSENYDVVIIGAGPGGYVAGIRAAQLGLKACVIEKDKPGGVCLNWGCIPSKNLLQQAELFHDRKDLEAMGLSIDTSGFDYAKVHKKSRGATQRLVKGVEFLLKKNKVAVIKGSAKIRDKNTVDLDDGTQIKGKNLLIATGSRPFQLPGFECDEKQVLSSTGLLAMTELPGSMIILGAGAIGCEFAYVMNAFGVQVTLVEMVDHILPFEDEETVAVLAKSFTKSGITLMTSTKAVSLSKTDKSVTVTLEDKDGNRQDVTADKALAVFGRTPNTDGIGLENIGIETRKGYIPVGDYCRTTTAGVYAIGDVVATPLLAHVASKEGEIAVEHMAGHEPDPKIDINAVPSAIYCEPQVASFGLRESQAVADKIAFKKTMFPYRGIGKATATGKSDGMIKVLYDPETHEILGAHIVGHDATELIHELLLAKVSELVPEEVAGMIHAHPTISEGLMEALRGVDGQPIHM